MRYKVKVPDAETLRQVKDLLSMRKIKIFTVSERRGLLSAEDIPIETMSQIRAQGGHVSPEFQFDLE